MTKFKVCYFSCMSEQLKCEEKLHAESQLARNFLHIPWSTVATSLRQVYTHTYTHTYMYNVYVLGTLSHDLLNICALGVAFSKHLCFVLAFSTHLCFVLAFSTHLYHGCLEGNSTFVH